MISPLSDGCCSSLFGHFQSQAEILTAFQLPSPRGENGNTGWDKGEGQLEHPNGVFICGMRTMGKGRTEGRSLRLGCRAHDSSEHMLRRNVGGVGTSSQRGRAGPQLDP